MTTKFFNKNSTKDGVWDASKGLGKNNTYNEGSASWREYERAYNATFTPEEKAKIQFAIDQNCQISESLELKLYEHFCNNGEMPYGTAKARTGDPTEFIYSHMHEVLQ
jgi:hypothetical protein